MKRSHPRHTTYLRRHQLAIIICVAACTLAAGFITTITILQQQSDQQAAEASRQSTQQTSATVKKLRQTRQDDAAATPPAQTPPAVKDTVMSSPSGCRATNAHSNPHAIDIIVNKKNCIQPLAFVPTDMQVVFGATISAKAIPDFTAMHSAAQAAGVPFIVSSSYRSYDQQITTYDYWVSINGHAGADTVSARAGYSEHQTGLTVDLASDGCWLDCFTGTPQQLWLQQHAAQYGFVERYPIGASAITGYSPESWHYRYVGVQVAQDMKKRGIATLEQYWNVTGGDYAAAI